MTPQINGDMNSGDSYWFDVAGYNPFVKPYNLTWNEEPAQIDSAGSVITDMILAGKVRLESDITYVYAIGHTGRLYKIQVNNPSTFNPDYDNPVLLATLSSGTPTFTRGAFIDFYGSTERIYISHDKGVTRIDFDGTNETVVGVEASWTQTVPKPLRQFLGNLYVGHGTNIAEISSTALVATYSKLSPSFPIGTQIRDMRLVPDGNYLQMVVTRATLGDITTTTPETYTIPTTDSYIFSWNGVDTGATALTTYPSTILEASTMFGDSRYVFGRDSFGESVYNPIRKLITELPDSQAVGVSTPNAIINYGDLVQWTTTILYTGFSYLLFLLYGSSADFYLGKGFWAPLFKAATSPETDVLRSPCQILVSNSVQGGSTSGYANQIIGTSKVYYSTLEVSSAPTTKYRFYKWVFIPRTSGTAVSGGLFQTQNQVFSQKISIKQVRVYAQPWVTNNGFTVDMIGSNDLPIANGSYTFTVGTNLTAGDDIAKYSPDMAPTYSLALRITNNGTKNFIINKVEIDYEFEQS